MTERRVFRGRAGPTDRRLPKHNARQRKRHPPPSSSDDASPAQNELIEETSIPHPFDRDTPDHCSFEEAILNDIGDGDTEVVIGSSICTDEDAFREIEHVQAGQCTSSSFTSETRHLLDRIQHSRETIQLSAISITIPSNYQKHVLNGVVNVCNEWKAILRYYSEHEIDISQTAIKSIAATLFDLIQHALQCGPLKGSKAGYWKRCGSEVASAGFSFLDSIAPTKEAAIQMRFSDKQADALVKWKAGAKIMSESDKPPSKYAMSQLQEAVSAKAKATKIDAKKQQKKKRKARQVRIT